MSSAEPLSDGSFDICHQLGSEFVSKTHFQEEKNTLVFVLGTALSNAQRVIYTAWKRFQYGVDFSGSKTNAAGIQDAVTAKKRH